MLSQNVDDEIFYIISTTSQFGNTWIKESDNLDFSIGFDAEIE